MQKGFAQIFVILLLLTGLVVGIYLVGKQTFLKSEAVLTGTRVEIFGPTVSQGKTTSRWVKLRIIYEPPQTKHSSPAPAFTKKGDFKQVNVSEGIYTMYFQGLANNPSVLVPDPIGIEIKNRSVAEVIISTDGKPIICPENAVTIGTIHCLRYNPDILLNSPQLKLATMPPTELYTTVVPKDSPAANTIQQPTFPTHFKVANVTSEIVGDVEVIEAKKALSNYGKEYLFSQNNQEIDWDIAEGQEGNGLKKVYVRFDDNPNSPSITGSHIILEQPSK